MNYYLKRTLRLFLLFFIGIFIFSCDQSSGQKGNSEKTEKKDDAFSGEVHLLEEDKKLDFNATEENVTAQYDLRGGDNILKIEIHGKATPQKFAIWMTGVDKPGTYIAGEDGFEVLMASYYEDSTQYNASNNEVYDLGTYQWDKDYNKFLPDFKMEVTTFTEDRIAGSLDAEMVASSIMFNNTESGETEYESGELHKGTFKGDFDFKFQRIE